MHRVFRSKLLLPAAAGYLPRPRPSWPWLADFLALLIRYAPPSLHLALSTRAPLPPLAVR